MIVHHSRPRSPYNPWADLAANWPEVSVIVEPMSGTLLGELRYPVIALRANTSAAQRRCTLTHEIVHLERGVDDCGPWAHREELAIEREVAQRLIPLSRLVAAIQSLGGSEDHAALAAALEVDHLILHTRLDVLSRAERQYVRDCLSNDLWSVA